MRISRPALFFLGTGLEFFLVALLAKHGDFLQRGEAWKFTLLGFCAGLACWLSASAYAGLPGTPETGTRWFWVIAIGLRLAVLPCFPGDDLWRYRWEGAIQLHGFNPYQLAPDAAVLVPWRDADWHRISHLNFPAIYPPLAQGVFRRAGAAGKRGLALQGVVRARRPGGSRRPPAAAGSRRAAWYAWNPLVVYAFAGAAHFDSLMILALLGAVWALEARDGSGQEAGTAYRLEAASALLLGLAVGVKIAPVVLLPTWAFAVGRWRRVAGLLPLVAAPTLVPALWYGFPGVPVFAALGRFGRDFRVNEPSGGCGRPPDCRDSPAGTLFFRRWRYWSASGWRGGSGAIGGAACSGRGGRRCC